MTDERNPSSRIRSRTGHEDGQASASPVSITASDNFRPVNQATSVFSTVKRFIRFIDPPRRCAIKEKLQKLRGVPVSGLTGTFPWNATPQYRLQDVSLVSRDEMVSCGRRPTHGPRVESSLLSSAGLPLNSSSNSIFGSPSRSLLLSFSSFPLAQTKKLILFRWEACFCDI